MPLLPIFLLLLGLPARGQSGPVAPVPGYADLHTHMFTEYAFDGAWLHGTTEGELAQALASCDSENHARVGIPGISSWISPWIGKTRGGSGDTGPHPARRDGFPTFQGWPRWDTIAHQQVWGGHLEAAHRAGLNLLVVSLMNFEPLCRLMPEENRKFHDCSDTATIDRELDAVERFERTHPWFRVVRSPGEARGAIRTGKLAVVLSIETSHLFGDGDWKREFEKGYQRGVRTLQLAHEFNSRFAGAALHHPVFRVLAWLEDFRNRGRFWEILTPQKFGFQMAADPVTRIKKNRAGLTAEGRDLVRLLMSRGMPIDLAHLSEQSVRDLEPLTRTGPEPYPVYLSHGHFREIMDDGHFDRYEKSSPPWVLDYVRDSRGMFGLRTGPEKTKTFPDTAVPNDCHGTTKSFAQSVQYGESRGLKLGFATDFNGFAQQLRPRFGGPEETCGEEGNPRERKLHQILQTQPLHERFDQTGLGDMSQLPQVWQELKNFELKVRTLHRSAEDFIEMWERAVWISKTLPPEVPDTE